MAGPEQAIAVVGMSARFPGAPDVDTLWRNLHEGRESITFFSEDELATAGVPTDALRDRSYVRAGAILPDVHLFDAAFFGLSPREAELMDPQHRIFLECAWEALERAGASPAAFDGRVGVYAGAGLNTYLLFNVLSHPELVRSVGMVQLTVGADKDHLATRVSYKLNLRGPSLTIQSACSTSLVAVHLACESLLGGECDMALAGGATVTVPQTAGYWYERDGIVSPDGHCRAFDARAAGTVLGSGAGVVVLKRLEDALADRDHVHAIIRGTAVNNDGAARAGYAAPSVEGQAAVVATAQALAGVDASSISYVEAHGTGTQVGDPIEVAALTRVFGDGPPESCALGSVKTNIGHTVAAAGVAGLIKTVLCLEHASLVPSLHFEEPNPLIDFARSPFRVSGELAPWPAGPTPRRAGVSSFGMGGTNAHVVLEEAPRPTPSSPSSRGWPLLVLSARTSGALDAMAANLARHLDHHPELDTADVASTLQAGRQAFDHRLALVCGGRGDAVDALRRGDPARVRTAHARSRTRPVVFLFPGQGPQLAGTAHDLYLTEPVFQEHLDAACDLFTPHLGTDLRTLLFPARAGLERAARQLDHLTLGQPALFAVEHALARLWMAWGVWPQAMLGHSLGEYAAACVSGVLTLEDAVAVVAARGRLLDQGAEGLMLGVRLAAGDVAALLGSDLTVAAINGSAHCTVAGPTSAVEALRASLEARGVESAILRISRPGHSPMVEPAVAPFVDEMRRVRLREPAIPFVSNVTGTWITPAEACDPAYWGRHLRQPVRFADGVRAMVAMGAQILLEVGPGITLRTIVRRELGPNRERVVLASGKHPDDDRPDARVLRETLGDLWLAGGDVDWAAVQAGDGRRRVALPTYPFERRRSWIDPAGQPAGSVQPEPEAPVAPSGERGLEPLEERIASVWRAVLGVPEIGPDDDFFELGGDSLLAVRVASRLSSSLGFTVEAARIAQRPTLAQLAAGLAAGPAPSAAGSVAAEETTGMTELTPGQHWLFTWHRPEHMSIAALYEVPAALDAAALQAAFTHVLAHHDALRAHYVYTAGGWRQFIPPAGEFTVSRVNLSGLSPEARAAAFLLHGGRAQRLEGITRGPLPRVVHFDLGPEQPGRLLIAIPHLVTDGFSQPIIEEDVQTAYRQLVAGGAARLPARTSAIKPYLDWLAAFARSGAEADLDSWLGLPWELAGSLPVDFPGGRDGNVLGAEAIAHAELTPEETDALYRRVLKATGTEAQDVLLAGLAQTVTAWTGTSAVHLAVLGHRRDAPAPAFDLSRTVGYLAFADRELLITTPGQDLDATLAGIAEQRRRLPSRGFTFEVLSYMGRPEVRERIARRVPRLEITFNYARRFSTLEDASDELLLCRAHEDIGPELELGRPREVVLVWMVGVSDGRLAVDVQYATSLHRAATIQALADGHVAWLRSLINRHA